MTPQQRFHAALECRPLTGRVPHFELEFFLTMEAFGCVHPSQRHYAQWGQMSDTERRLHLREIAGLHARVAETFEHAAILFHAPRGWAEDDIRACIDQLQEMTSGRYALMVHGDCTFSLPGGDHVLDFVTRVYEDPAGLKAEAERNLVAAIARGRRLAQWKSVDTMALCSDYCFNTNPFLSPDQFAEFVTPYLARLIEAYRDMGFYVVKHTDGNIMPILDQLVACRPHALHSLDPQGGVDIAEVKRLVGDRVCLIGNVSCAALQTGTPADVEHAVRYALTHGMPGYGYVFSTSNCVYTGMPLERYKLMLDLWRTYGNYPEA